MPRKKCQKNSFNKWINVYYVEKYYKTKLRIEKYYEFKESVKKVVNKKPLALTQFPIFLLTTVKAVISTLNGYLDPGFLYFPKSLW